MVKNNHPLGEPVYTKVEQFRFNIFPFSMLSIPKQVGKIKFGSTLEICPDGVRITGGSEGVKLNLIWENINDVDYKSGRTRPG